MYYNNSNVRDVKQKSPVFDWILSIIVSLYIFMRWYKVETYIMYAIIFFLPLLSLMVLFKDSTDKKNAEPFPVLFLILIYMDYFLGMTYSPYLLGQKSFSLIFLFCFALALYYSYNIELGERTFKVLLFFSLISCGGIILQFISSDLVDKLNKTLLQAEAYKMMSRTLRNGYITGINGYVYMSSIFALILFGFYLIKILRAYDQKTRASLLDIVMISVSAVSLIMTQKRSMLVCLIGASLVIMYIFMRHKPRLFGKIVIIAFFAGILFVFLLTRTSYGVSFIERFTEAEDVSSGRFDIYNSLIENIDESILLGKGTGSFNKLYESGAHNVYLQILYENGAIGLVLWVGFFVRVLVSACKKAIYNSYNKYNYLNVFVQCVFLIYAFFGNPLYNNAIIMLYFVCVGYTYCDLREIGEQ